MSNNMSNHYDAIIIGGRVAGSSLAIRLAKENFNVFMIDRAHFPSLPQVPSSPIIHAGTMRLMDELGLNEKEYTHPDGIVTEIALSFIDHFTVFIPTALMTIDRNYGYGIDRNHFDLALWERASKASNVDARSNFSALDVLTENGKVIGITGKDRHGTKIQATADIVIGADGRFSFTARAVGANVVEERNEYIGASYHAEWENVEPISSDHPHTFGFYNTAKGIAIILIPIDTKRYIVAEYFTMNRANFGSRNLESCYLQHLQSIPDVWKRIKNARRITNIVGVKGIQNGYRTPYGPGWALVGDAVHYKDPIDGQGIYDALLSTKILAEAMGSWKRTGSSWDDALKFYQDEFWKQTHPMFLQTVERIKQEIYGNPPSFIINTIIRWTLSDPEYQEKYLRYLYRAIDPSERPTPHLKFFLRGIKRDLLGK